jgi:hypothetical protein
MSFTFDPYKLRSGEVSKAEDVLMTNPTALQEMEAYWSALPRMNGVPKRKDVDPSQMGGLLEDSFILERVAPGVARVRVAGRNIGKLLGIEPRGLPLTASFLHGSRAELARHLEAAFTKPGLVELSLTSPRAVGQPALHGKLLLLPLRDDQGRVSRLMGVLAMSGRRGLGGRRFEITANAPLRFEPTPQIHAVQNDRRRPSLKIDVPDQNGNKAKGTPALRLVVSNS